jgi:prephenate dehydrogenase
VTIAIVGCGLIGTSLGLALHRKHNTGSIAGWDHNSHHLEAALAQGAIDRAAHSLPEVVHGAKLVVLATPLDTLAALMQALAPGLALDALVTDVAGVKAPVLIDAKRYLPGRFVGGHPMAGGAQGGPAAARDDLFRETAWAVCPPPDATSEQLERLEQVIVTVGAKPLRVSAGAHDAAVSWISHLPQLLALELLAGVDDRGGASGAAGLLAAGGFRDLTRIGTSPSAIWQPVLAANRHHIASDLIDLSDRLRAVADDLRTGASLAPRFELASRIKRSLS